MRAPEMHGVQGFGAIPGQQRAAAAAVDVAAGGVQQVGVEGQDVAGPALELQRAAFVGGSVRSRAGVRAMGARDEAGGAVAGP